MNTNKGRIAAVIAALALAVAGAGAVRAATYDIALTVGDAADATCGLDIDVLLTGPDAAVVSCGKGAYRAGARAADGLVYVVDLNAGESVAVTCQGGALDLAWGSQRVALACGF